MIFSYWGIKVKSMQGDMIQMPIELCCFMFKNEAIAWINHYKGHLQWNKSKETIYDMNIVKVIEID